MDKKHNKSASIKSDNSDSIQKESAKLERHENNDNELNVEDTDCDSDSDSIEPYRCLQCDEEFNYWKDLISHLKQVHKW